MNTQSHLSDSDRQRQLTEGVGNRKHLIRAAAFLPLALIVLCGAAPPPQGTSITGGMGYSDQQVHGGCSAQRVSALPVYVSAQHQFKNNISVTSELTSAAGLSHSPSYISSTWTNRVGYHGNHAGIELGPRLSYYGPDADIDILASPILWSVQGWAGNRESLYGYFRSFAGPQTPSSYSEVLNVGIGYKQEWYEVEMDWPVLFVLESPRASVLLAPELHAAARLQPQLWLGMEVSSWNHMPTIGPDTRVMFTLTMRPDEVSRRNTERRQ